jgi:ABC-type Fe3+ transport system permease subunit
MLLLMLSRQGWALLGSHILSYRSKEVAAAYSEVALLVSKAVVVLIEYIISGRSSDMSESDARHIDNTPIP